jgi:hypothetical protein
VERDQALVVGLSLGVRALGVGQPLRLDTLGVGLAVASVRSIAERDSAAILSRSTCAFTSISFCCSWASCCASTNFILSADCSASSLTLIACWIEGGWGVFTLAGTATRSLDVGVVEPELRLSYKAFHSTAGALLPFAGELTSPYFVGGRLSVSVAL